MCFYADADWCAEVEDTYEWPGEATKCDECGKPIPQDGYRFHVSQREHEECQEYADWHDDDDPDSHDCEKDPGDCDFGESFMYDCCRSCKTLREAIRKVEEAEGCTGSEAQPALLSLFEDVSEGEGWDHYADKFRELGLTEALALVPAEKTA